MEHLKKTKQSSREFLREMARNHAPLNFFFRGCNFLICGTKIHDNGSCIHTVKNLDITDKTKKRIGTITEADLQRIRDLKK